jgi:hyperosmotically inducible periplasmic protein
MRKNLFVVLGLALLLAIGLGCSSQRAANDENVKERMDQQFEQAGLTDVNIDQDQEQRVLTLSGEVESEEMKSRAEEIAKTAAPGYTVANEIGVRPEGEAGNRAEDIDSAEDEAIEAAYKAELTKAKLEDIDYDANNGVLTLTGNVDTAAQRDQAEKTASKVKGVEQVVNKLEVENAAAR